MHLKTLQSSYVHFNAMFAADHTFDNYASDYLRFYCYIIYDKSSVSAECQSWKWGFWMSQLELNTMTVLSV